MPLSRIFNVTNMCFIAIREHEILAKISEFTVVCFVIQWLDIVFINENVIITLLIIWPYTLYTLRCDFVLLITD